MSLKSQPLIRALGLLWGRMGAARMFVIAGASGVVVLAAFGVVHLVSSSAKQSDAPVHNGAMAGQTPSKSLPPPSADDAVPQDPLLAITEVTPRKQRLRNGATSVAVRIGVAPRPDAKKGEVEIRVFFYDVTQDNEMRPTEAQVAYEWITPIRDWTDPAPKYLQATYLRPRTPRQAPERLRYGGFIVRVYFDGQIQDERSEPKEILAALRSAGHPTSAPSAIPARSGTLASAASPSPFDEPPAPDVNSSPARDARVNASSPPQTARAESSSPAPYASPVPNKLGFVYSPYNEKFLIDVRGFPPGTEINDPNTGKPFRVP